jgi:hypothetical protein
MEHNISCLLRKNAKESSSRLTLLTLPDFAFFLKLHFLLLFPLDAHAFIYFSYFVIKHLHRRDRHQRHHMALHFANILFFFAQSYEATRTTLLKMIQLLSSMTNKTEGEMHKTDLLRNFKE